MQNDVFTFIHSFETRESEKLLFVVVQRAEELIILKLSSLVLPVIQRSTERN